MSGRKPKFVIVLAGGKGTRMHSADCPKVCFLIDGRPAINRALDVYKACGIEYAIVVVGAMAEQVMETVSQEHPGAIYAYQAEQIGTGDAARHGALVLDALADDEDVLLVAGDRIMEPIALERLIDVYYSQRCDLAFIVGPKGPRSGQGRVILDADGSVLANVEVHDVRQRRALARILALAQGGTPPCRQAALELMRAEMDDRRAAVAFGSLWRSLSEGGLEPTREQLLAAIPQERTRFELRDSDGERVLLTPDQVEGTPLVNVSVYLVKARLLGHALNELKSDNAQREEYLSDIINGLAQWRGPGGERHRVCAVHVDNPNHVLGFNNPSELLEIEVYLRQKRERRATQDLQVGPGYRPVIDWVADLERLETTWADSDSAQGGELCALYGNNPDLLDERRAAYLRLLVRTGETLGEHTPVLLVRAPGRINILGRHIDHQGGNCNLMAIDREIIMAVHPRGDDQVCLYNVAEEPFGSRRFSIADMLASLPWDDWLSLVNSRQVQELTAAAGGDWSQYVRAAVLRLQHRFPAIKLRGMDLVVYGNIPIAAGLSSSSALVVATAEATVAVNRLEVLPAQFVDLCGEGEWFVGTRGGSADHAAMKFGQRGKVAQVTFFDFGVEKEVDFPADHCLVICNSGIQAQKAAGARDVFNHRIACYRLGVALVRARYAQYAPLIQHLRDINVRTLGVPLSWIYRILLSLPERASREELEELLPAEELAPVFATHAPQPDGYPIRGVVLYGLAECERSRMGVDLLGSGRVNEFGRLMSVSHDGDRVVCHDEDGNPRPYRYRVSNVCILDLMAALESGDPRRVEATQLQWQPGAYGCSTAEIDLMVDLASRVEGVAGAQLAGAGLGGCMMVLAHRDAAGPLAERMCEAYYAPRGLDPDTSVCVPIAGSGVLLGLPKMAEGSPLMGGV